jgi:hypothetical protein
MMNFIESSAGRIAARIQSIGASFDPEVLSLPGGSAIAVFLWLYASAAMSLKRSAWHSLPASHERPERPVIRELPVIHEGPMIESLPAAACVGCLGHR